MVVPVYQAKADLLRVLGHPARIRVLELLAERDHAAGELLERIPIEAGSLSQQLAVLRRAGLVGQRRDAGTVVYTLLVVEVQRRAARRPTVLRRCPATGTAVPADLRDRHPARRGRGRGCAGVRGAALAGRLTHAAHRVLGVGSSGTAGSTALPTSGAFNLPISRACANGASGYCRTRDPIGTRTKRRDRTPWRTSGRATRRRTRRTSARPSCAR